MARWLGFAVFFGVSLGIVGALHYYFFVRLVRDVGWPREWRLGLTAALVAAALSLPLTMILGRALTSPWRSILVWPAFLWMGVMFLLFVLLAGGDLILGLASLVRQGLPPPALADPARRLLLSRILAGGATLGAVGLSGLGVASAWATPRVRRVRVPLRRLPPALDGFVLVQLSDLHIGDTITRTFVSDVVGRTNALRPDLIVITGDLVDGGVRELAEDVALRSHLRRRPLAEAAVATAKAAAQANATALRWSFTARSGRRCPTGPPSSVLPATGTLGP